jgi:hypothetical protein
MTGVIFKYLVPSIGAAYFTATMTYMVGITKGRNEMFNNISKEYDLVPKNKDHLLYDARAHLLLNSANKSPIGIDVYEQLG